MAHNIIVGRQASGVIVVVVVEGWGTSVWGLGGGGGDKIEHLGEILIYNIFNQK